jgi:predicted ester cyclase
MSHTAQEERNIAAFRLIIERIINDGETDLCEDYMHPDMAISRYGLGSIIHLLMPDRPPPDGGAIAGFKAGLAQLRQAFPDWHHSITRIVAKDDWVSGTWKLDCTHQGTFMGVTAAGTKIAMEEAGFMRFEQERMIEGWFIGDELALARQLGIECKARLPNAQ